MADIRAVYAAAQQVFYFDLTFAAIIDFDKCATGAVTILLREPNLKTTNKVWLLQITSLTNRQIPL